MCYCPLKTFKNQHKRTLASEESCLGTLVLSSMRGENLTAVFDDHRVTFDAGVLLLRGVEQRMKLIDALTDAITGSRHSSCVRHEVWEMGCQRLFPWPPWPSPKRRRAGKPKVFDWLESRGIFYVIKLAKNAVLQQRPGAPCCGV